jgi:hypothetical protein
MQTTHQKKTGLQSRTAQWSETEAAIAKYIVIVWGDREQVVTFPFEAKHSDLLDYLQRQNRAIKPVSAGFIVRGGGLLWVGGESLTLSLKSRPQDRALIHAFLTSEDRRAWDLTQMAAEAKEAAALLY